ncbi:HlyD family secretion protein [Marinomonas algarum]|uniref:HlyD family efflux transporter periplasmic adaptor subunit n=1 Tax=Marinomonas algarum TaxID=2883105 RepID=A0A9X1RUY3_9GAMM|nr:HlyD family efflux transporter periplasmic adaptor subunit [Marinomonas algarum]MCB5162999.1 HlyD family efflux transporter periplasmic adaptor subunit [Marinomonas algarum]
MTSLIRWILPLTVSALIAILAGCQSETDHRAMGTLERERFVMTSPITERIHTLLVEEGQFVNAGDVLLTLDDQASLALITQRQAEQEYAVQTLNSLLAGTRFEQLNAAQAIVDAAKANYQEATLKYHRAVELYQKKAVSKADLDTAEASKDASAAKLEESQARWLELKNGALPEAIAQAQAQLNAAKAVLAWQQVKHDELTLRAPVSGIIDTLPWHTGERVTAGTQILSLLADTSPYARVYVPATARAALHIGDVLDVWVEGIDTPFIGTVRNVRSQPAFTPFYALNERDRARLMYLTDIELQHADELPTGLAVEVRLP